LFGPKWNGAILPFQILVVYGMARCLWADPLEALGRFDLSTWLALVASLIGVFAIYFGLHYGLVGIAWAVLVVVGGAHVGALYLESKLWVRLVEGLRNAAAYLLVAGGGIGVALFVHYLCASWVSDRPDLLALGSATTVFAVYGIVFWKHALKLVMMLVAKNTRESGAACAG
jgi:O-antigen/teichoic acid export membrane protein